MKDTMVKAEETTTFSHDSLFQRALSSKIGEIISEDIPDPLPGCPFPGAQLRGHRAYLQDCIAYAEKHGGDWARFASEALLVDKVLYKHQALCGCAVNPLDRAKWEHSKAEAARFA